jgi:hypothetical protein
MLSNKKVKVFLSCNHCDTFVFNLQYEKNVNKPLRKHYEIVFKHTQNKIKFLRKENLEISQLSYTYFFLSKVPKAYIRKKMASSTHGAGNPEDPHVQD